MVNYPPSSLSSLLNTSKSHKDLTVEDIVKKAQSSSYYKQLYKPYPNVKGFESFDNLAKLFSTYLYVKENTSNGLLKCAPSNKKYESSWKEGAVVSEIILKKDRHTFWVDKFLYNDLLQYKLHKDVNGIRVAAPCALLMLPLIDKWNITWLFWICGIECGEDKNEAHIYWWSGNKDGADHRGTIILDKLDSDTYTLEPSSLKRITEDMFEVASLILKFFLYLQQDSQVITELPIPTKAQGFGKQEPLLTTKWLGRNDVRFKYPLEYQPKGTHKSPITHERRGYWKNVPIGKKGSGEYIRKWIRPTTVNEHLSTNKDLLLT